MVYCSHALLSATSAHSLLGTDSTLVIFQKLTSSDPMEWNYYNFSFMREKTMITIIGRGKNLSNIDYMIVKWDGIMVTDGMG